MDTCLNDGFSNKFKRFSTILVFFMFFFVIALLKTQRQTGIFITKQKGSYANTFTGTGMH